MDHHGTHRSRLLSLLGFFAAAAILGTALAFSARILKPHPAHAASSNIYIAQTAAGAGNGADCNDAYAYTFFNNSSNWGTGSGKIGPGTTVYLCGNFTAPAGTNGYLQFQGSGASGNPITLFFEPGAVIESPYWGTNGAITASNLNYITVNLGSNGVIETTANGSAFSNQQAGDLVSFSSINNLILECSSGSSCLLGPNYIDVGPVAISSISGNGTSATITCSSSCQFATGSQIAIDGTSNSAFNTATFLTVTAVSGDTMTVNSTISGTSSGGDAFDESTGAQGSGNVSVSDGQNVTIQDLNVDWAHWCVGYAYHSGDTDDNLTIDNNTITDCDHGVFMGAGEADAALSNVEVYGNNISNGYVYDDSPLVNDNHHDGFHAWGQSGSSLTGLMVFDNYFHGNWGAGFNSFIFLEENGSSPYIFNNIINDQSTLSHEGCGYICMANGTDSGMVIANNVIIGPGSGVNFDGGGQTGGVVYNNIYEDESTAIAIQGGASMSASDFNDYYNVNSSNGWNLGGWSGWHGAGYDPHGTTGNPNLNSSYIPQTGSAAIGAGMNLTSYDVTALDSDYTGTSRPSSGAWTIGAYQVAGSGGGNPTSTPPTISISSPSNNATISGTVTISGTAAQGSASLSSVAISLDGGSYTTVTGTTNWSYSLNTTGLSNGTHTITAKVIDSSGNTATASVSVTVSNSSGATGNIYISQSGVGSANGTNCSNAYPVSFFNTSSNWGNGSTQIGPGDTVYLCGTFNAPAGANNYLQFQSGGTSGNPITLDFEPNAVLTAPYWGIAINLAGNSYITINGGTNGVIQATENGTLLADQEDGSVGIYAFGSSNVEIKNLTIANLYVHSCSYPITNCTDDASGSNTGTNGILFVSGSNDTVDHDTIHDVQDAIGFSFYPAVVSANFNAYSNTIYNVNWGVTMGDDGNGSTLNGSNSIHNNVIYNFANWDDEADHYHHDGIYAFMNDNGSLISGLQIYSNYIYGDPGIDTNTFIYLSYTGSPSDAGGTFQSTYVFNNLLVNNAATTSHIPANGFFQDWGKNITFVNNTMVGEITTNPEGSNDCMAANLGIGAIQENNICSTAYSGQGVGPTPSSIAASDYNDFYDLTDVGGIWGGAQCTTLLCWQGQTGGQLPASHDLHSITSNPKLSASYIQQSGSPVIGAGVNLTSLGIVALDEDYVGNSRPATGAWDLGAYYVGGSGTSTDTTPPTTSITSPVNGATVSSTITVAASASDNVGVTQVQFYLDGVLQSTDVSAPYTWSWNTTSVMNGTHSLMTEAYDAAGNMAESPAVTVTVANPVKPSITSSLIANAVQGSAFSYQITASNTPTSYNATGLPSGLSVNTVSGVISGTPTVSGTFSIALSASNVAGTGTATLTLTVASISSPSSTPLITSVSVGSITQTSAQITVALNRTSSIVINYGTATSYGQSSLASPDLSTVFENLSDLSPNTMYDFDVVAIAQGTTTPVASQNFSFTTEAVQSSGGGGGGGGSSSPAPSSGGGGGGFGGGSAFTQFVSPSSTSPTSEKITVTTSLPAQTELFYGTSTLYGTSTNQSIVLATSYFNLTNLIPHQTYYVRAVSLADGQNVSNNFMFVAGQNSATVTEPVPTPPSSPAFPPFTQNLTVGSTGSEVLELQTYLDENGYPIASSGPGSPGNETSYFGSLTAKALGAFQAANGISPDVGYFGPLTREKLNSLLGNTTAPATTPTQPTTPVSGSITQALSVGSSGPQVTTLQTILTEDGDYTGPVTGYFGDLTEQGVKNFQAKYGIVDYGSPDTTGYGSVGPKTRDRLNQL